VIQRAVPGDGRGPTTETIGIAQSGQVTDDLQPRLRGDILGILAHQPAQVPQQSRLDRHVERVEGPLVALLCRDDAPTEVAGTCFWVGSAE